MNNRLMLKIITAYEELVEVLGEICEDEQTSPRILKRLSKSNDPAITVGITLNPSTPVDTLLEMYKKSDPEEYEEDRVHIAYNRALPLEIVKNIVEKDSSEYVREMALTSLSDRIANTPKVSSEILSGLYTIVKERKLVRDKDVLAKTKRVLESHPCFPKEKKRKSSRKQSK